MKVAITCDYLFERNHYTEVIETVCELFPEARLYCFAHKQGAILGHIEQRVITSTFLSHKVNTEVEFYKYSYQIPSIAKNLFVSCEYDLIINISKGFSQGIKKCERTKIITYLYDLDIENKMKDSLLQKIFSSYVQSWAMKLLKKADLVIVSRDDLKAHLAKIVPMAEVAPPPFRISDYSLFPKEMFKHHFFAIEAKGLKLQEAKLLVEWMKEWNFLFQFIGPDEHLSEIKTNELPANLFFGNKCSGEHAPVLASSMALISFNHEEFPNLVLATMATGRPVIVGNELKKWISGTGTFFASLTKESLKVMIDEVLKFSEHCEGQKIRAHVMEYHDIKFKAHLKRVLDRFHDNFHEKSSQKPSSDCQECN